MKTLRYILLSVVFAAVSLSARAEFRWGPQAGAGLTTLKFKQALSSPEGTVDVTGNVGPRLGVQGELNFPGIGLGLRIGALYAMDGATMTLGDKKIWASDGYGTTHLMLHTLEIPINLQLKWTRMNGFEDTLAPIVFGGPVFSFNVAHSSCKAFEYPVGSVGLRAGVGFEIFKKWQLCGSYTWGMTYAIKAVKLENYSARNRYWAVSLTRFF